jgi:hypothetical protein
MCVYKFIEQNHNYVECIEGNFKDDGVITLYKNDKLEHYNIKNNKIIGLKN